MNFCVLFYFVIQKLLCIVCFVNQSSFRMDTNQVTICCSAIDEIESKANKVCQ